MKKCRYNRVMVTVISLLLTGSLDPVGGAASGEGGRYIVSLRKGVDLEAGEGRILGRAAARSRRARIGTKKRLTRGARHSIVLDGLTAAQASQIASDPEVAGVVPDLRASIAATSERRVAHLRVPGSRSDGTPWAGPSTQAMDRTSSSARDDDPAQAFPVGIRRIKSRLRARGSGDEAAPPQVGVAVIDTGVDSSHPDLNVVQKLSFVDAEPSTDDFNGHGTHVAGTIAAKDNGLGVVGVIPGAQIYALKALNVDGTGNYSDIIEALDWVYANASKIAVVNMSISGGTYSNEGVLCGASEIFSGFWVTFDPLHEAICDVVSKGVVVVVAAGNDGVDSVGSIPAKYPEVITVSAIVDTDGEAGGLGPAHGWGADDSFAGFSNYGPAVDLAAPGVEILSTYPVAKGEYAFLSGTSMATPHVVGAVALHIARYGKPVNASDVAALRTALLSHAVPGSSAGGYSGDPDGAKDPLLSIDYLPFRK